MDFPSQSSPLLVLVVGAGLAVGLLLVESVSSTQMNMSLACFKRSQSSLSYSLASRISLVAS